MSLPYPNYVKIRNRYCVAYYGPMADYVLQLLYLCPAIEKELPGLELYISCRDDFRRLMQNTTKVIFQSEMANRKKEVAYIRELRCDFQDHPVWQWVQESKLTLQFLENPQPKGILTKRYMICEQAIYPTKPIPNVQKLKDWIEQQGFIAAKHISEADWIVGTENEELFAAAMQGIRTTLIPTGLGTELYKKLFPAGEICNMPHIYS